MFGKLHRIIEQVGDDLTDTHPIDVGPIRHMMLPLQHHVETLVMSQCRVATNGIADHRLQPAALVIQLQLTRFYLGEIEDVIDQIEQVIGRGDHIAHHKTLVVVELAHLQQFEHAMHA